MRINTKKNSIYWQDQVTSFDAEILSLAKTIRTITDPDLVKQFEDEYKDLKVKKAKAVEERDKEEKNALDIEIIIEKNLVLVREF